MGLVLNYISSCQNTPSKVRHLNINLKVPNQSLQLANTKSLSKKSVEYEKSYQNIRTTLPISANGTFILQYSKAPNHCTFLILFRQPQFGLQNWKTLKDFERN